MNIDLIHILKTILEHVLSQNNKEGSQPNVWLAFSGGLDSRVLAAVLSKFCQLETSTFKIKAIHVNHQLSNNASIWQEKVEAICKLYQFPLTVKTIHLPQNTGESLEALARERRYQCFYDVMEKNDILLTAHHQDDQIETFFMNLLRGAGLEGLNAMPLIYNRQHIKHVRPFLTVSRQQLWHYAKTHHLNWCEDESNRDLRFDRNYWRADILPMIKKRYPGYQKSLIRTIQLLQSSKTVLDEFILKDYQTCIIENNFKQLSLMALKKFSVERQSLLLRHWFRTNQIQQPSEKILKNILHTMLTAKVDASPMVCWGQIALRRYRQVLCLTRSDLPDLSQKVFIWTTDSTLFLPDNLGRLEAQHFEKTNRLTVRFQSPSATLIYHKNQHQSLKKLYQQAGIPPWLRPLIPCVYDETNKLVHVGNLAKDQRFFAQLGKKANIVWQSDLEICLK